VGGLPAVEQAGMSGLAEGQKVRYDLEAGRDGKSAAANPVAID
jgi:CspA family cold shock protein